MAAFCGNDFKTTGVQPVTFTAPSDWATTTINSQGPFYFIRAETQTGTTTAVPLAGRLHIGRKTAASYSDPTVTAAAAGDNIGDQSLTLEAFPPSADTAVPALTGAITDEGIAAAVLTVALVAPTAVPAVLRKFKT